MTEPTHYHQRIQRATERLAQLQARELLASQRQAARAKATQQREQAKRRARLADLVFLAGAETLDDGELVGALLLHMDRDNEQEHRQTARSRGAIRLAMAEQASPTVRH
ncbi:TPA: conjugal transfer protein TraD [Stenotrophomonas maltophilia]|nr:conjugal transfer protein TraD [Stenotrophomonas maltophilia]